LKELDQEKDIEFKYYYNNLKDCNTYYTEWEIEEILNKVYLKIERK
jgi:hypothetical protein